MNLHKQSSPSLCVQDQWEEDRVKMSMQRYGAKDKAKEEQYELLVEDQIEFISHELLKGIVGIVVLICSTDILYCSSISVDRNAHHICYSDKVISGCL
jgi:hypothetical protein